MKTEQMLNPHKLDALVTSLKNEGFTICLSIQLSEGENRTAAEATALAQLQSMITSVSGAASALNAAKHMFVPCCPP